MMRDENYHSKLEEVVSCSERELKKLKEGIYTAFFSTNVNERKSQIFNLNGQFGGKLKRGYLERNRLFLVVNVEGYRGTIDVGEVPEKYMDVGYHVFEN